MNLIPISVTPKELVALWNLRLLEREISEQLPPTRQLNKAAVITLPKTEHSWSTRSAGNFHYAILGEKRSSKNSIEAYIDILRELSNLEPSLPIQLAQVSPGNSRNHIATSVAQVYPRRPDLGKNSLLFAPGWFAGTNIANREKIKILDLACKILCLEFGVDVMFG